MNKDQLMRNFTEEGRLNVLLMEDKKTKQYMATLGKTMQDSLDRLRKIEKVTPEMYDKAQKSIADLDNTLKQTSAKIDGNIKTLMGTDSKNAKEIAKLDRQTKSLMDNFDRTTEKMANELSVIKGVVDTFSLVTHDKPKDGEQGLPGVGIDDAYMDMGHLKLKLTDGTVKDLGKIAYGNDVVPQIKKGGRGDTGIGIKEIARTSGDGSPGTTDTYTITYTDDSLTPLTYEVYNGKDGLAVVRDNLTTDSSTDALSAKQGKVLNDIVSINQGKPLGVITMPNGFEPTLACDFAYNSDGTVTHDFDFGLYRVGTEIYINSITGSDTTGNGTEVTPYRSLGKAFDVAIAGAGAEYVIKTSDAIVTRSYSTSIKTINAKRISIIGVGETNTKLTSGSEALSWVEDGAGTWKAARSAVYAVFDVGIVDSNGAPIPLTNVTSAALCQATAGTWYTDNTNVWVHASSGLVPTVATHIIGISVALLNITLTGGATLYTENIDMIGGQNNDMVRVTGDANTQGTFIANNCKFVGGYLRNDASIAGNSLALINIKNTYLFNCISAYAGRDGLNYHFASIPVGNRRQCLVVEYGCKSYEHGAFTTDKINNSSTCHEGATILRICGDYENSYGPVIADVNGCFTVMYDCFVHDCKLSDRSNYYFADSGEVFLYNCAGGGKALYDLESPTIPINAKNFKGYRFSVPYINYI